MFKQHREALLAAMSPNSIAVFSSAPEQVRSRDTEHLYRQDSDFYYFTGFTEPGALLLLINAEQPRSVLFNRRKDKLAEIWHGRRLGQDAAPEALGVDEALPIEELAEHLPKLLSGADKVYLAQGRYPQMDQQLFAAIEACRQGIRQGLKAPAQLEDWRPIVDELRLFKSDQEVALMAQAGEISARGHVRAMQSCRPGMWEYQLEAEIHHEFAMAGCRAPAYGTIVGGGDNACILHYTENEAELQDGDLVLIDAGAEYQMYAGDITRTFPVNGRFSQPQAELYQIVLDAQLAALDTLKPGASIQQAQQQVIEIMLKGLLALGIVEGELEQLISEEAHKAFYMHGLSHWLGIDVHDVGDYRDIHRSRTLEPGMALTVEPGLYIAEDADVPEQYRGIGIRIEDDIVITEAGNQVLTAAVPKEISEIEALMSDSSKA
ncbi:Xaa-Pro aminopeptidase [Aliagarivorans marinus]|uniref:Xaa-Pro aminopeptidase n=1 Tax=Aliagarivorans marinus TaxID=561965 RepID=UPI00041F1502|nr:Xaa-Pro aminopeptidase [Aliagarivorans marinus]